jgi:hypothetical protein
MTRITRQFLTHCRTVFGLGGLAGGLGTADWGPADWGRRDQKMSIRKPMKEKKYTTDQKRGGLGVGGLGGGLGTERSKNEHS